HHRQPLASWLGQHLGEPGGGPPEPDPTERRRRPPAHRRPLPEIAPTQTPARVPPPTQARRWLASQRSPRLFTNTTRTAFPGSPRTKNRSLGSGLTAGGNRNSLTVALAPKTGARSTKYGSRSLTKAPFFSTRPVCEVCLRLAQTGTGSPGLTRASLRTPGSLPRSRATVPGG